MNPVFISRYRVLEEVGRGGMGIVYKAEDPRLERLVAVKILPPKLLKNKEALRRFLREAKVAAKLDHPNIIPIFDVGEDNGVYYMVMEYLEGQTLREWIEARTEIDIDVSLHLFKQIANALDYAHHRKVIHRDVKPENIMVLETGNIRVMDFGIAVMDDRHSVTQAGAVLGTIAYISPEQSKGNQADIRSDIYSLGIVFYEFLTGELPFEANTPSEMLAHHLSTRPPVPSEKNPNIPKKLDRIILKTLEKNPEDRYQSVSTLLEDLEETIALEEEEEKYLISPAQKDDLGPAELPTKIMEPDEPLLPHEVPPSSSNLTKDSFVKYRLVVERIQKDLAALADENEENAEALASLHHDKSQVPCAKCGTLNDPGLTSCSKCGDALVSSSIGVAEVMLDQGIKLYEARQYKESLGFFQGLIKKNPKLVDAYRYAGLSCLQLQRYREALTTFRKGTELDPYNGILWQGLGDAARELSHDLEALQAYQQAVQYTPSATLWLKLGKAEESLNHFEEARRALSKSIEFDPGNRIALKSLISVLMHLSQFQEAHEVVKKMLALDPKDPTALRLLGQIYENTNRYNQALEAYEKALTVNPKDSETLAQLGQLHEKQDQVDLAVEHLAKAAEVEPDNPDTYVKLAQLYLKRNEEDSALTYLEKAANLSPNDPELHKELGRLFLKRNDLNQAMVQFEWTVALDPSDPEAHGRLGQIYHKQDQTQLSIREYKTAIELDPYNPEFHENLGMVYYAEQDLEEAVGEMERAITLDPRNVDYRKALGVIYESKGKFDFARKEYQKAIEASPRDYLAQTLLGRVYLEQDLVHLAIFQFQKALSLEARSHLVHSLLGKGFLRLGQYREAIVAFQRALELAPKPNTARTKQIVGKNYFYLGQCLLENSNVKEAAEKLARATQFLPTFAKAFHLLGKAQYILGDRSASKGNLEHAARLSSEDAEIFADLAEMLAQAQDYPGAIEAMTRATQIMPEHAPYHGLLGDLFARKGDLHEAIHSYQQALHSEKNKKGIYHGKLGMLFMRTKDYTEAVSQFKKGIELSPENWYLHQDLAKAYQAMGKIEEALLELETVKRKSLNSDALTSIQEEIERLKKQKPR